MSHPFIHIISRGLIGPIDAFSEFSGRLIAWLTLLMALAMGMVVVMRYGFGLNSIALQESVIYMHAAVFLLGTAYTLKHDGHVRVDIFYSRFSPVRKAWVNSIGGLVFLLPVCGFLLFTSWHFVATSWRIGEISTEPGGIPAVFLLKTLIPLAAVLLALQGVAEALRGLLCLMTDGLITNGLDTDSSDTEGSSKANKYE
ncbi:MAG: TRAP transporter small permease subunit [Cellvibrionaceae bacterium]